MKGFLVQEVVLEIFQKHDLEAESIEEDRRVLPRGNQDFGSFVPGDPTRLGSSTRDRSGTRSALAKYDSRWVGRWSSIF